MCQQNEKMTSFFMTAKQTNWVDLKTKTGLKLFNIISSLMTTFVRVPFTNSIPFRFLAKTNPYLFCNVMHLPLEMYTI